ncbi:MAG: chorismate-binding protein [Verrucomicrobia bacterium]|nr:chorismate-binding protein [Verrucomicrobiota bacterium]
MLSKALRFFAQYRNFPIANRTAFRRSKSAIAGTPTQTALDFIATHELFDRGWYAGCIGHKKGEHSEVFVWPFTQDR